MLPGLVCARQSPIAVGPGPCSAGLWHGLSPQTRETQPLPQCQHGLESRPQQLLGESSTAWCHPVPPTCSTGEALLLVQPVGEPAWALPSFPAEQMLLGPLLHLQPTCCPCPLRCLSPGISTAGPGQSRAQEGETVAPGVEGDNSTSPAAGQGLQAAEERQPRGRNLLNIIRCRPPQPHTRTGWLGRARPLTAADGLWQG